VKIEIVTMAYNDLFLMPFFLLHYSYADHIRVILDADTEDGPECERLISQFPMASSEYFRFANGYDLNVRQNLLFTAYQESTADWVITPDSDEFIFCDDMHGFLAKETADIVKVRLYQVFRNEKDVDLDPSKPIKGQRKYGDPLYVKGKNSHGTKPIIMRAGRKVHLMPGNHGVWNMHRHAVSNVILAGQHWQMADPGFCVSRRISRRKRFGNSNFPRGYAFHDLNVTEEYILSECNAHMNDEELPG
jgi:hypothetical protein